MEAIILAGGLGTRLRTAVPNLPKCMAKVGTRPFLEYLLDNLIKGGVTDVVFSVGYKSNFIQNHFRESYKSINIKYAKEKRLLGTGGAIVNSLKLVKGSQVIIVNGDSLLLSDLKKQLWFHNSLGADVTFALKPLENPSRYGTVIVDGNKRVLEFKEKQKLDFGLINTGCYIFETRILDEYIFPEKFSIENEFFQNEVDKLKFFGFETNSFFLDIGIPSDFKKAQLEIGVFPCIDFSWTLFLDRDGVINKRILGDYVRNEAQFEFIEGAVDAICFFSKIFKYIIVVTNQQGIGKGLMSVEDLSRVHQKMLKDIKDRGGRIDAVYFAPQRKEENSIMRKPNPGMAHLAKSDFSAIDFNKSLMIGDSLSDMEFAINSGITPLFISVSSQETGFYNIDSLVSFSRILDSILN